MNKYRDLAPTADSVGVSMFTLGCSSATAPPPIVKLTHEQAWCLGVATTLGFEAPRDLLKYIDSYTMNSMAAGELWGAMLLPSATTAVDDDCMM